MRRPLRFVDGAAGVVDLTVDASSAATVGELADRLAEWSGEANPAKGHTALTVVSRWPIDERSVPPPRSALLSTHGPRAGSTAMLVPAAIPTPVQAGPAPVRLVSASAQEVRLGYGPTRLGDTVVEVADQITVRALGGSGARLGGVALLGSSRIADGDLLTVGGVPWTVCIDGPLEPPAPRGWTRPHARRPAINSHHEPTPVALPTPPGAVRLPGFPVLSATVPLLMAVALWLATGSALAAGFMVFSVVFVVASGLEARREARAEDRARVAEFRDDLADVLARLHEDAVAQRRRHAAEGRSPRQLRTVMAPGGERPHPELWERGSADAPPSLTVRLGTADRPRQDHIVVPDSGRRSLRRELEQLADERSSVADIATLDLFATGGLVVEGTDESAAAVARAVVAQLAALIGPDRLGIAVEAGGDRVRAWADTRWLPHCSPGRRPRSLVVADGADPVELTRRIDRLGPDSTVVVWVAAPGSARPTGIGAVLEVDDGRGRLRIDRPGEATEVLDGVTLEPMEPEQSEPLARCLAGLEPAPEPQVRKALLSTSSATEGLPDSVLLSEIVAARELVGDPDAVARRWAGVDTGHLATPIGVDEHGGVVNLDLRHDGPHALVAGTTGAGKSELLRTWLVSAALHHSPDRLHLLLIDYKGGAAFGPLAALPHTVGTITDLSGPLARRGLVSLRAELRRREEELAARGTDRWTGAALVVVVDELATLVSEQPDFVDGLVDLAQRGRSLGIHLVLATQRPAGVVSDAIRANATMRVALRVADRDDSRDVVDSPAAAHLPRDLPGRAVVRLGPARTATLQVAFCGSPHRDHAPVTVEAWNAPRSQPEATGVDEGDTELQVAVRSIISAASVAAVAEPRRPWLDPLPERIELLGMAPASHRGALVIGTVDRPDLQRRDPLEVDLVRDGGLVVIGASGAGASTVVRTLVDAAANDPHCQWHVHVIDSGAGLGDLVGVPDVGDVVGVHDNERVLRVLRGTVQHIEQRSSDPEDPDRPRRLLVIDGIAAMEERYEQIDRGEAMALLASIARDGRSAGVHLVVTAQRRAEVPMAVAGTLSARLVLRCATADDAAMLGLDEAAASGDLPPGRCRVDGHLAQVAVSDGAAMRRTGVPPSDRPIAAPVPRLPTLVRRSELAPSAEHGGLLAVGLDGDTLATAHLDLRHHHGVVAGPPRSGVSSALRTVVDAHPRGRLLVRPGVDELAAACAAARFAATQGQPSLVAIDDVPDLLDGPDGQQVGVLLGELARAGRDHPVRIVLGGEVDAMTRCYDDLVTTIRRGRTGLLLGGDPEVHGALLRATLRHRSDLPPAPGRGWLLGPGSASPVQLAHD